MDSIIPAEFLPKNVNYTDIFEDSCLLFDSNDGDCSSASDVSATNRAALEDSIVIYLRHHELDRLSPLAVHGTPSFNCGAWDRVQFAYPSKDTLLHSLRNLHLRPNPPDLIIIEHIERFFDDNEVAFARNLRAVTFFLRDILLHLRTTAAPGDHGSNCRVLVSCRLPVASFTAQSSFTASLPHGLAQTCILQCEGDGRGYRLTSPDGTFEFKVLRKNNEFFFTDFSMRTFENLLAKHLPIDRLP